METRTIEPDPGDDDLSPRQYAARLAKLPTDPDRLLAHVKGDRHWRDKPDEERGRGELAFSPANPATPPPGSIDA